MKFLQKEMFCMLLLVFVFSSAASHAQISDSEVWQFFRINAQYRGALKKSFQSMGCALAWFKELPENQVQAIIHVCALHPEKKNQVYSFRLNLIFQRQPGRLELVREIYAEFNGITGERQQQIRQLAGLWLHMLDYKQHGTFTQDFMALGALLKLERRVVRNKNVELTCKWQQRKDFSGKFFFDYDGGTQREIDKFRFRSGKLSVSLVKDSSENVTRDFAKREPFAQMVFK